MRLRVISDVHLEFAPLQLAVADADVVIAAGDIGVGAEGLSWLAGLGCPVIYVAGNHEFWGEDIERLPEEMLRRSRGTSVHFLENRVIAIGDVRFLGCTLWTDFDRADRHVMSEVRAIMNDYRRIRLRGRPLAPEDLLHVHQRSRQWLEESLREPHDGRTVVVTHHAPSFRSCYDRDVGVTRFAYCNAMDDLFERYPVDLWVHGHIHRCCDYNAGGARVVCNPRGYVPYKRVADFEPGKIVTL